MPCNFVKNGSSYYVTDAQDTVVLDTLPVGTYSVGFDRDKGLYFVTLIEDMKLPSRIYGKSSKQADRIMNTYLQRSNSTGVLLSGEKGSGKTLLGKQISGLAREKGWPTLVISQPHCGVAFNQFIQGIVQDCVVFFDEFEKLYDNEHQEAMLTLLDGVYNSKKLYILTCNDSNRIDGHMTNRPGRIFYMLEFGSLEIDFIREYCQDNLVNKEMVEAVCRTSTLFNKFNFDILQALVEDMNRYDEGPLAVLEYLNANMKDRDYNRYNLKLFIGDREVNEVSPNELCGSPLLQSSITVGEVVFTASGKGKKATMTPTSVTRYTFTPDHMTQFDSGIGRIEFFNGEATLICQKVTYRPHTLNSFGSFLGGDGEYLEGFDVDNLDDEMPFVKPRSNKRSPSLVQFGAVEEELLQAFGGGLAEAEMIREFGGSPTTVDVVGS